MSRSSSLFLVLTVALAAPAWAQQPPAAPGGAGKAVFDRTCAGCHANGTGPSVEAVRQMAPDTIVNALTNGRMQEQGSTLTPAERVAVAEFLAGRPVSAAPAVAAAPKCTTSRAVTDPNATGDWNGWGNGPA